MQRLEFEMAIHNLVENLDLILEHQSVLAKVRKKKFDALMSEGFTEAQALIIVSKSQVIEC